MNWFKPPEPKPEEPPMKFLEVMKHYGGYGFEFYDAANFRPHLPSTDTLQIQRNGQQAPVAQYGPGGWMRFRWVMRKPSDVALYRADTHL